MKYTFFALCILLAACSPKNYEPTQSVQEREEARRFLDTRVSGDKFFFSGDGGAVLGGYRYASAGQARHVVVAFHGLAVTAHSFAPMARELSGSGFEFWCPDRRGLGLNSGGYFPHGDVSDWHIWVRDALLAVRHVQSQRPGIPIHLVGISMGAATVIHCAGGTDGQLVDGVKSLQLLVPPLVLDRRASLVKFIAGARALTSPHGTFYVDTSDYIEQAGGPRFNGSDADGIRYLKSLGENTDVMRKPTNRGFRECLQLISSLSDPVEDITLPTNVILAGNDELVNSEKTKEEFLEKLGPHLQAEPRVVADETHMLSLKRSQDVAQWVKSAMIAAE